MSQTMPKTITLNPVFVEKIWGGRRLESDFGYDIPEGKIGECWAISAHPNGDCTVADGPYAGSYLSQLWSDHRELFGGAAGEQFPLLVKILDASEDLSVQVHPGDEYAALHENGSLGKSECWYILDADEGADIICGQHAKNREEFAALVAEKRWDDLVNRIPIHKGDFFPVPPGTVHAILKGTLILETQQSSDVTYRVYDFDRPDAQGNLRELHLEQSLDVVDYDAVPPTSGKVTAPEVDGITHLLHSKDFDVIRVRAQEDAPVHIEQKWDYLCVSAISGEGSISVDGEARPFAKGEHFIATCACDELVVSGSLELICSYVER